MNIVQNIKQIISQRRSQKVAEFGSKFSGFVVGGCSERMGFWEDLLERGDALGIKSGKVAFLFFDGVPDDPVSAVLGKLRDGGGFTVTRRCANQRQLVIDGKLKFIKQSRSLNGAVYAGDIRFVLSLSHELSLILNRLDKLCLC